MKTYKLKLRELVCYDVTITAENLESAKQAIKEGDGEYSKEIEPSSLPTSDIICNMFESGTEDGIEIDFKILNDL